MKKAVSIQARLLLAMLVVLILVWLIASGVAARILYQKINEQSDAQMVQIARRLLTISDVRRDFYMHPYAVENLLDDDTFEEHSMTFVVWDEKGEVLVADQGNRFFRFQLRKSGFYNIDYQRDDISRIEYEAIKKRVRHYCQYVQDDAYAVCLKKAPGQLVKWMNKGGMWRVLYLHNTENGRSVAVGQSREIRRELLRNTLGAQLIPWMIGLPFLLFCVALIIRQTLRPLRTVAESLKARSVHDDTPIKHIVPSEMQPLIDALNRLFERVSSTIAREQRFTADAAHELRSPLAALKVHTEVLALTDDENERLRILANLQNGIDRAHRLVEQLLIMNKIDPMNSPADSLICWKEISEKVLQDCALAAREKRIRFKRYINTSVEKILPITGDEVLMEILLRNLIDNAVRYCPPESTVTLTLEASSVIVEDNGMGIEPVYMERIGERFFRPPGQSQAGSGLGISIVKRIAQLHQLKVRWHNKKDGGLKVVILR